MDSKEPLLESWPDGKVKPFLEDGDDGQQRTRVKSRNPFNFVGFVILGLIALGALRMNHIKMDHIWPARKQHICKLHKEEMITDFKQVRTSFHLLDMLPAILLRHTLFASIFFSGPHLDLLVLFSFIKHSKFKYIDNT